MARKRKTFGGPQSVFLGAIIGLLIGIFLVLGPRSCNVLMNYDYSGEWNKKCNETECRY